MKELKDFIHLYLGCECKTPDGILILNGLNINDSRNQVWFYCRWNDKKNCYLPKQNAEILGKQSLVGKSYKFSAVKLILRPLSDMKISEGIWCLKETYFAHVDYPESDFYLEFVGQKNNNPRIGINNDWYANELTFGCSNGSIWNAQDTLPCNTKIKASVFAYLISKHFDLFGLIEAGLAIDKTTLKEKI